jgi:hypothetical protein
LRFASRGFDDFAKPVLGVCTDQVLQATAALQLEFLARNSGVLSRFVKS